MPQGKAGPTRLKLSTQISQSSGKNCPLQYQLKLLIDKIINFMYTMYQRKVDVDMLNAVKSVLADVSSVSPLSELHQGFAELCSDEGLMLEMSAKTLFTVFSISTSTLH